MYWCQFLEAVLIHFGWKCVELAVDLVLVEKRDV